MNATDITRRNKTPEQLTEELTTLLRQISELDTNSMEQVQQRLDALTKPQGSLGDLERIAIQLGGIQHSAHPQITGKAVLIMAGDHGVVAEGVSAFPQEVTPQMFYNIRNGGAAINVLSRQAGAEVICTDVGLAVPLVPAEWMKRRVAGGTRNIAREAAMTRAEAVRALLVGADVAREAITGGVNLLATGDLGIGNTTPSAAIIAVFTDLPVREIAGRGTGLNDQGLTHKRQIIEQALRLHHPDPQDPLDVLSKVGGLEIAALAGVILQAAASHTAVVIDGVISTAGAMIAAHLKPRCASYMIASHCSEEPGHIKALQSLGLHPPLNLSMRLGEGTGAAMTMYLVEASLRILTEMATFAEAAVSGKKIKEE
ncbi:MAG: nicotinate-nucleotide--dimethylbenzimidazole phosphoribosyltransferase [Peptococcaceae bacterium]|jgi:nicotinate-nucleotide--dimethylbenzimidazole phosphoribosyltransferase|nr:nicotinate-nucleotide--dimethylbenzimidazole phosphoribosyltransferase [Peptococcaceae bacterium]